MLRDDGRPADPEGLVDQRPRRSGVRWRCNLAASPGRDPRGVPALATGGAGLIEEVVAMTQSPVDTFLAAVEHGSMASCSVWSPDAVLDATVPQWRFRRRGPAAIRAEYAGWFADPAHFEELCRYVVEGGEVVRYLLTWVENGVPHAAHHVHLLAVDGGQITSDTVLCGGRWPASLLAEMQAEQGAQDARDEHEALDTDVRA